MKSKIILTITLISVFALGFFPCAVFGSGDGSATIKWYKYREGLELSKSENKLIFLTFYADWCGYCKVMDKQTFANKDVIASLNKDFISIKVNSDKERDIAKLFRVRGLPDSWFISEKGVIGHRPGYIAPDQFLKILDAVVKQARN